MLNSNVPKAAYTGDYDKLQDELIALFTSQCHAHPHLAFVEGRWESTP